MIDARLKEAWQRAQNYPDNSDWRVLADAYVEEAAGRRMAEHQRDRELCRTSCFCKSWTQWKAEVIAELDQSAKKS